MSRHRIKPARLVLALLLAAQAAIAVPAGSAAKPEAIGFRIVASYPHDPAAFTQGLVFASGWLYEGTGIRGASSLRRVKLEDGEIVQMIRLPSDVFGEGITVWGNRIYQLTWDSGICYVYDQKSFKLQKTFDLAFCREGWGITHDGRHLIVSDGSWRLYFVDPENFACLKVLEVREGGNPVRNLNELEYRDGRILANVWLSDRIVVIDPQTGDVCGRIDCSSLVPPEARRSRDAVLNGIALDGSGRRLLVTGKLWPKVYLIELLVKK